MRIPVVYENETEYYYHWAPELRMWCVLYHAPKGHSLQVSLLKKQLRAARSMMLLPIEPIADIALDWVGPCERIPSLFHVDVNPISKGDQ